MRKGSGSDEPNRSAAEESGGLVRRGGVHGRSGGRAEGSPDAGWRRDRAAGGHTGVRDGRICEVEEARQMKKTASQRVSKSASQQKHAVSKVADGVRTGTVKRDTTETQIALTLDRKSTRLNSSHLGISYAVFC